MSMLIRFIIATLSVFFASYVLKNVGVYLDSFKTAIIVALVLAVCNMFLKPIFVFLTIPFTIVTFGLFLLVINGLIVLITDYFVKGFEVKNLWIAILFSLIVTVFQSIIEAIATPK